MDGNSIWELCQAKNNINFGASVDLLFLFCKYHLTKKMFCLFSVRRLCLLARGLQNKHPNYQEL